MLPSKNDYLKKEKKEELCLRVLIFEYSKNATEKKKIMFIIQHYSTQNYNTIFLSLKYFIGD